MEMYRLYKIILYDHPIKNYHFTMSYQENEVKWGDIVKNIVDSGLQCKVILYVGVYSFFS
jgi:hypothetical protein